MEVRRRRLESPASAKADAQEPSVSDCVKCCPGDLQLARPPDLEETLKDAARLACGRFSLLGLLNGGSERQIRLLAGRFSL